jgi:hypothetical protein
VFARLESMPGGDLDATALVDRRVLDEGDQAAGHEAARADRLTSPRHLPHLHHPAGSDDLDPTAGPGRDDLERLDALPGVDHRLDSITFHAANDTPEISPDAIDRSLMTAGPRALFVLTSAASDPTRVLPGVL